MNKVIETILPIPIYAKLEYGGVGETADGEISIELILSKDKKELIETLIKSIKTLEGEDVIVIINLLRRRE